MKSRVWVLGFVLLGGGTFYFLSTLFTSNFIAITCLSLGIGMGAIPLVLGPAFLMETFSKRHLAKMQGTFMAIASLGGIIAPYVTGRLVENMSTAKVGFHTSFQLTALLLVVSGSLVCLFVKQRQTQKGHALVVKEETMIEDTIN